MTLVTLGRKPLSDDTPAGLILDCHARIRSFAELAVQLGTVDASDAELADTAAKVHRYFTVALPLHVADEEASVSPRLRLLSPIVADALIAMESQHRQHDVLLARLIPAWREMRQDLRHRRDWLADARFLQLELEKHLVAEERLVVPALAQLSRADAQAIVSEMRHRRSEA